MTMSTEDLLDLILQCDNKVLEALESQTDLCLSANGATLLDAAIASDNRRVIDYLLADKKLLEFAAPIADDVGAGLNYMLDEVDIEYPLQTAEDRLRGSFGMDLNLHRTPLHTACRLGNDYAIKSLLAAGAKPAAKDRLKLTAPEICFYARGPEGLATFIQVYKDSGQKPFTVNVNLVRELLHYPELLDELKQVARFGAPILNLLLCYYCATLNVDLVRRTLGEKFDINKSLTTQLNPLLESCTSQLVWSDNLPQSGYYAYHCIKYRGPIGSHSIHIPNELIKPDGSNFGQLMREAERERKKLLEEAEKLTLTDTEGVEQIQKRCEIIDLLMAAGLDIILVQKKLGEDFFDDLMAMSLQPLVRHLQKLGFVLEDEEAEKAYAETFWELVGESTLDAKVFYEDEENQWRIELTYSNVYGPVDDIELKTRQGDVHSPTPGDKPENRDDWQQHKPEEEWLDVDGDLVLRASIKEPIHGETPWQAVYRWTQIQQPEALEIWVKSPSENINRVLSDWVITH